MSNKVKSENRLKHDTKWHKMTQRDTKGQMESIKWWQTKWKVKID